MKTGSKKRHLSNQSKGSKKGIPIPDDDSLANLIAAIAGGIEAPIQFILQVKIKSKDTLRNLILHALSYIGIGM